MIKYFIPIIFILCSTICSGQNMFNLGVDFLDNRNFLLEVKQLDQFIKRFNNQEEIFTGNDKNKKEFLKEKENINVFQTNRKKILASLLNLKDSVIINNSTIDFIEFIGNETNHISLSYFDNDWYATVNCEIIYRGKNQNLTLTLQPEGNFNNGFKWVIVGARADFINIEASRLDTSKFISPMNHELGFMDLSKVFADYKNIPDYTNKQFMPDVLSVILFLVKSKEIQYVKVNSTTYHFLQIKNWIFTVDYFNRYDSNSGWLISSIKKSSDREKLSYKVTVLSIK